MEGLTPRDILLHAANVIVLFLLLRLILWRPVERYLSARAGRIQGELDAAEAAKLDAEALKLEYDRNIDALEARGREITREAQVRALEYERNIDSLEARGREIMREAQVRANEQAAALLTGAKERSETLLTEARARVEEERVQAVALAQRDVAALASEMAARILRREVNTKDDVTDALDSFDEAGPVKTAGSSGWDARAK
jgi:F-type H+-transporting ATPase subunit b